MTVVLKPCGRGNWTPMRLDYAGPRMLPMEVHPGDVWTMAGIRWRVCEVRA